MLKSLAIWEMQIKIPVGYYIILSRMAVIKINSNNCWDDVEIVGRCKRVVQPLWKFLTVHQNAKVGVLI